MMTLWELVPNSPSTVIPCVAFCFTDILYCTHVLHAVDCEWNLIFLHFQVAMAIQC